MPAPGPKGVPAACPPARRRAQDPPGRSIALDELRARLESIAEELADLALDRLRQAADDVTQRDRLVAEERRLTRARRAVEKAVALLGDGSTFEE